MGAISYGFTGSLGESGAIAVAGALVGLVSYAVHERVWNRIAWGRHLH